MASKTKLNYQLTRVLRNRNFSPLNRILELLPELEPKDQVEACFKIMTYLYPKPLPQKKTKRKNPVKTIEGEVTDPKSGAPVNIVELLDAATKKAKN